MGRMEYLKMSTDQVPADLIKSDLNELKVAAKRLINDATRLGGLGFGTFSQMGCFFCCHIYPFFFVSSVHHLATHSLRLTHPNAYPKRYLLILDRTNWRTNMLTSLLVPYIFFSLPSVIFNFLRGEVGKWIAFIAVVLRLFFPRHFPDWLEMPGSLILLLVVAPSFFAHTLKDSWVGVLICLLIGCYLLQEHIRASGGFRNSFTQSHGISNTVGIILLLVYPVWALVLHFI
ncbi:hypothetical protein GH714_031558 [Hevea brasiliensis]|uniref:Uncharacterized protein n=1 Tax=Hevea brasiliensis TaxID=3981 RepID=A0A6A6L4V6_HEVBR|nr:hypothetical protein GH714_031558 [Hevea brasiliensis]